MIDPNKKLKIPMNELTFIKPDIRQKLFMSICKEYPSRYGIKLLYAALNTNPENLEDYLIIFKARNDDNTKDLILYDLPAIFTDRSVPGYRYCLRNGITKDFFDEGINSMVTLEKAKFYEYVELGLNLSRDKNDASYWKNPNNKEELMRGLLDMSLRYKKKDM